MYISVVIPAYNESNNIKQTIEEILSATDDISAIDKIQIIIVDDHSTDNTYNVISQLNDERISCLRLSRRSGSHIALRAGLKEAEGDAALCFSADGQDDPYSIKEMLEKWLNGARVIWALRKDRKNESLYYRMAAQTFYIILSFLGGDKSDVAEQSRADFFLLDRSIVDAVNSCYEQNTHLFGLIGWLGFNQDIVKYERRKRRSGRSKWSFRGKIFMAKEWITAFSGAPLKLMSLIGISFATLGFLYAIYLVINYYVGNPGYGWSSIMVAILVIGGIQMFMLGVIGEYLWRNLEESRKRPLYFIERKTKIIKDSDQTK